MPSPTRPATTRIRRSPPTAHASPCSAADDPDVDPQNAAVGIIGIDGGEIAWISSALDRNWQPFPSARQPVWTDDNTLLATVEDRGETHLYELAADGSRAPQALTKGPLAVQGFDAAGGTVATAQATVQRPAELFTLDGQVTTRDAVVGRTGRSSPCRAPTAPTRSMPGSCGRETSTSRRRYPVLLNVHGGPFTQYGETFFDEAQMQAAAGFVVVMCNPRGSSGRHTAWGQSIRGPKADDGFRHGLGQRRRR